MAEFDGEVNGPNDSDQDCSHDHKEFPLPVTVGGVLALGSGFAGRVCNGVSEQETHHDSDSLTS